LSEESIIVTFHTTHAALKADRWFRDNAPPVEIIPTPRPISSECGFTLLCRNRAADEICALLHEHKLTYEAVYREMRSGREVIYETINKEEKETGS